MASLVDSATKVIFFFFLHVNVLMVFVASATLIERLFASFPDNVDESMQHKVLDVADKKDVS